MCFFFKFGTLLKLLGELVSKPAIISNALKDAKKLNPINVERSSMINVGCSKVFYIFTGGNASQLKAYKIFTFEIPDVTATDIYRPAFFNIYGKQFFSNF